MGKGKLCWVTIFDRVNEILICWQPRSMRKTMGNTIPNKQGKVAGIIGIQGLVIPTL